MIQWGERWRFIFSFELEENRNLAWLWIKETINKIWAKNNWDSIYLFNRKLFNRYCVFYILILWYLNVVFSFTSVSRQKKKKHNKMKNWREIKVNWEFNNQIINNYFLFIKLTQMCPFFHSRALWCQASYVIKG